MDDILIYRAFISICTLVYYKRLFLFRRIMALIIYLLHKNINIKNT